MPLILQHENFPTEIEVEQVYFMLTISEEQDTNISVLGAEVADDKDDNLGGDEVKLGG